MTGETQRRISSMACGRSEGSRRKRSNCSGCSQSAWMPPESAFRVVSLPAMMSRKKFTCVIMRVSGCALELAVHETREDIGESAASGVLAASSVDWTKICSRAKRARSRLKEPGSPKRMVSLVQR